MALHRRRPPWRSTQHHQLPQTHVLLNSCTRGKKRERQSCKCSGVNRGGSHQVPRACADARPGLASTAMLGGPAWAHRRSNASAPAQAIGTAVCSVSNCHQHCTGLCRALPSTPAPRTGEARGGGAHGRQCDPHAYGMLVVLLYAITAAAGTTGTGTVAGMGMTCKQIARACS